MTSAIETRITKPPTPIMKRFRSIVVLVVLLAVFIAPLEAATGASGSGKDRSPAAPILESIAAVTGIAISPLLGTAAYGAYHYFRTPAETRGNLPWYAQMTFWGPALLLVGAVAAKDALGATLPPGWKKPLDVLETVENKVSGVVAAGAVIPVTMIALSNSLASLAPPTAVAGDPALLAAGGLATIQLAAIDGAAWLNLLTVPFGVAVFALVWMASHAINVLILLSPWGAVDAALKAARTGVLGLVTLSSMIDPWLGAICSVIVVVLAYFVAGWAFRLTWFGSVFCWDVFTFRGGRFRPAPETNKLFSAGKLAGVPPRTYGKLTKRPGGAVVFRYRPWLVLAAKEVEVQAPAALFVGRGLFFSMVETEGGALLLLPPRYRTHEEQLVRTYGFAGIRDAGLRRAWSWIRETMGFGPKVTVGAV
jgi:hypothetical protein